MCQQQRRLLDSGLSFSLWAETFHPTANLRILSAKKFNRMHDKEVSLKLMALYIFHFIPESSYASQVQTCFNTWSAGKERTCTFFSFALFLSSFAGLFVTFIVMYSLNVRQKCTFMHTCRRNLILPVLLFFPLDFLQMNPGGNRTAAKGEAAAGRSTFKSASKMVIT